MPLRFCAELYHALPLPRVASPFLCGKLLFGAMLCTFLAMQYHLPLRHYSGCHAKHGRAALFLCFVCHCFDLPLTRASEPCAAGPLLLPAPPSIATPLLCVEAPSHTMPLHIYSFHRSSFAGQHRTTQRDAGLRFCGDTQTPRRSAIARKYPPIQIDLCQNYATVQCRAVFHSQAIRVLPFRGHRQAS